MNRYGEIADELTDFIEEVASMDRNAHAEALKAALERAFAKACEAERALRVSEAALARTFHARGRRMAAADGALGAVVIELPVAWRPRPGPGRQFGD